MKKLFFVAIILAFFSLPVCAEEIDYQAKYEQTAKELADALITINNLNHQIIQVSSVSLYYQAAERNQKAVALREELKQLEDRRKAEAERKKAEKPKKKRRIEGR